MTLVVGLMTDSTRDWLMAQECTMVFCEPVKFTFIILPEGARVDRLGGVDWLIYFSVTKVAIYHRPLDVKDCSIRVDY
jgi:hypothetical protein